MIDQVSNRLDVFTHGNAHDLTGVQRQHHDDHNDGDNGAQGSLLKTDQQQCVRELTQLLVELRR
jgi:hypothetical protein